MSLVNKKLRCVDDSRAIADCTACRQIGQRFDFHDKTAKLKKQRHLWSAKSAESRTSAASDTVLPSVSSEKAEWDSSNCLSHASDLEDILGTFNVYDVFGNISSDQVIQKLPVIVPQEYERYD